MNIEILKQLGSEWQKGDKHRIYFNGLGEWYGIETSRYNTGNISSATLNGEHISNSQARKLLGKLIESKIYYDVVTGQWMMSTVSWDNEAKQMCSEIIAKIKEKYEEMAEKSEVATCEA